MTNNDLKRFNFDKLLIDKGYIVISGSAIIETDKYRHMRDELFKNVTTNIITKEMVLAYLEAMDEL
jgi:hypothetical protein